MTPSMAMRGTSRTLLSKAPPSKSPLKIQSKFNGVCRNFIRHGCININADRALQVHKMPQTTYCKTVFSSRKPVEGYHEESFLDRRGLLLSEVLVSLQLLGGAAAGVAPAAETELKNTPVATDMESTSAKYDPDTLITNKVYLDVGIAPQSFKTASERTLGDKSVVPLDDAAPAGRLVLGLYGNQAPGTVANFLRIVRSGALNGTTFSRVLPGEYIQAGQQGPYRMGGVEARDADLQPNPDLYSAAAFKLSHSRPGTLSLSLTENDEDPMAQQRAGYRNIQFLITTGPGPVPRLDGANIVFGRVLEGLDTVNSIAQVPTFKPSARSKQLNVFAEFIGDDRATNVRRKYGKPLKAVIIVNAGELQD